MIFAFDSADQTIRAYEVKRGNGQFDAGKIRSIKRDLMCVQVPPPPSINYRYLL